MAFPAGSLHHANFYYDRLNQAPLLIVITGPVSTALYGGNDGFGQPPTLLPLSFHPSLSPYSTSPSFAPFSGSIQPREKAAVAAAGCSLLQV